MAVTKGPSASLVYKEFMDHSTQTALKTAPPQALPEIRENEKRPKGSWGRWVWLAILVAAGIAIYHYWPQIKPMFTSGPAQPATGRGRGRGGRGGITQVVAARAQKGTIRAYLTGLGAVTPVYTVTLKSRVDGQLMEVHFKEGQLVRQGDPLVEIDPRPYQVQLEQAEGQLAHDQALLKNAHLDLERYQVLYKQDAIPQQQLATQEALVTQYDGTIKTDVAQIDTAKLNLVYCHIQSPITGRVGLRLVDPGNIVHATDTTGLVVITQLDPISVIFTVAEDQLPPVEEKLHAGQKLPVEAWDRENKNKLGDGALETIDNQIDPTTGTLRLRATFANPVNKLFPSQFVNARLLVDEKRGVTVLSNAGIQRNASGAYVWFVQPNQRVTVRPVTVGTTEGDQTEILSGLEPNDEVVTVGVDRLEDNGQVNVQVAGEEPAGGRSGVGKSHSTGADPGSFQNGGGAKSPKGRSGGGRHSKGNS
jgi:multidrug efflux system membrane fusion protein